MGSDPPEIKILLTLEDRFVDPISEGYDLVIRIGYPQKSPSLVAHHITKLPRVICAAPSYLEARGIPSHCFGFTCRKGLNTYT